MVSMYIEHVECKSLKRGTELGLAPRPVAEHIMY